MYGVCGNGRRPLGLVACGLLPQHTERETVLQTATRSVNNVKSRTMIRSSWIFLFREARRERRKLKFITPIPVRSVIRTRKFQIGNLLLMGEIFGNWIIRISLLNRQVSDELCCDFEIVCHLIPTSHLHHKFLGRKVA